MATSYSNFAGSGDRRNMITVTTTMTGSGSLNVIVNGLIDNSFFWGGQACAGLEAARFDFRTSIYGNQQVVIDEATWYQDRSQNCGVYQWQGSNDGTTWTSIGGTFTLGLSGPSAQVITTLNGNTTAYYLYRMLGVSGSMSSSPWHQEMLFKIDGFIVTIVAAKPFPRVTDANKGAKHQRVKSPAESSFIPSHFTPVPVAANLAGGTNGTAYTETITAQQGTPAYTFALLSGALPTGLNLAPSTGIISGTPTVNGTYSFTIRVTDSLGFTGTQGFQIIVATGGGGGGGGGSYTFIG